MGAFFGCVFGALIITLFLNFSLEEIRRELSRIADALEFEDEEDDPDNKDVAA